MMNGWWVRPSLSFLLGALLYPGSPLVRGGVTRITRCGNGKEPGLETPCVELVSCMGSDGSVSVAASGPVCPEGSSAESLTCGVIAEPPVYLGMGLGSSPRQRGRGFRASARSWGITRPGGR